MSLRIERIIAELTLEEKVLLLAGADTWRTHAVGRLSVPAMKLSDGPNSVRGENKDLRTQPSAAFPSGSALGATWNPDLVREVGSALGEECRDKGAHVLLAPTVNIHRHPLSGRNFECFSEDPYLSARMGVAFIQGVQGEGVGACVKHFVCNDQEFERESISAEVDERSLHEIYLPPFRAAVQEAGVWALMSAYNRINGVHASEHSMLLDLLKSSWGFDGMVISDWYGTYSDRVPSGGLDLEMPGPARWMGDAALQAVRSGQLDEARIDDKVRRILRTLERVGLLDDREIVAERSIDRPEHRALIRRAGAEAVVLMKNKGDLLPLVAGKLSTLAVIGDRARDVTIYGGGSAEAFPHYVLSPLDAIGARCGGSIDVCFAPGPHIYRQPPLLEPRRLRGTEGTSGGLTAELFGSPGLQGDPLRRFQAGGSQLAWFGGVFNDIDPEAFSLRLSGTWTAPETGPYVFELSAVGRARCWLDGEKKIDFWEDAGGEFTARAIEMQLEEGQNCEIRVEYESMPGEPWRGVRLGCLPPQPEDPIGEAEGLARAADAALVFVGLTPEWESEGFDRPDMDLPGVQNELVARVAAANPNTIVVLNAGSPLRMPWIDAVPAVLQMGYLGQEAGNAIADVLFGEADPGGRLPTTYPKRLEDSPAYANYPGENGKVSYAEGLFVGYRHYDESGIEPQFPFGHGLSYTSFEYANLQVETGEGGAEVRLEVANTGERAGVEVVQLYVRDVEASLVRPLKELKAFEKLQLEPGEQQVVAFTLGREALAFYDPAAGGWVVEPGLFEVLVGRSAADIRLRGKLRWEGAENYQFEVLTQRNQPVVNKAFVRWGTIA